MSEQIKRLHLQNIPESLIRRARSAAVTEGLPLYEWAIEAFEEKIAGRDNARDPWNVTERLLIACDCLVGSGPIDKRLEYAQVTILPLRKSEFPEALQAEVEYLQTASREEMTEDEKEKTAERYLRLLMGVWGPGWRRK